MVAGEARQRAARGRGGVDRQGAGGAVGGDGHLDAVEDGLQPVAQRRRVRRGERHRRLGDRQRPHGRSHGELTTTAAGSVIYGAGNDYDKAVARTLGTGQAMLHQWLDTGFGDSYWVQYRISPTVTAGSTATINDSAPTADRWNLAAVEVVP